jgi:translation initiation factor 2B subunit (eIF-2B alpha/beta/delta family)
MAHVVRCFVRNRGRVLLLRGTDAAGSAPGRWDVITGCVGDASGSVEAAGRRVLRDAVGLADADLEFVRSGRRLADNAPGSDPVSPVLFESDTREVAPGSPLAASEWIDPTAIRDRDTVAGLYDAWRHVAPTVETVRADRTHGSAWIAARAVEVLRDAAAEADAWRDVAAVARDLRTARPEMAAVANAVDRTVAAAGPVPADPETVVARAIDGLEDTLTADDRAGRVAARHLRGSDARAVATLSRSGTVREALRSLSPDRLVVAESRPEREGVGVAEWAAVGTDAAVTLTTEAGLPTALASERVDAVLVGADSITPAGDVVNKTGTRTLALAAREAGVPVYVAASTLKIRPMGDDAAPEQTSPTEAVYDGDVDVSVHAPTFEPVPGGLVDGVATEDGMVGADGIRAAAEARAADAAWTESAPE